MKISARAEREMAAYYGGPPVALGDLAAVAPRVAEALVAGFGDVLGESGLGRAEREIATVAALVVLGDTGPQLAAHGIAARRAGVAPQELSLLLHHLLPYAGFPRVLQAVSALRPHLEDATHERTVELDDHATRVIDRPGDRDPLVLIHAIGLDRRMWSSLIDELPTDRRVIAYDVRGQGHASDAPAAESLHDLADDLAALLDQLDVSVAQIAGLSFGGAVAQTFALDHPERVSGLDLIGATTAEVAPALARWFTAEALAENGWPVRYARDMAARAGIADWVATCAVPAAADIAVPTRVIAGELDIVAPPETMRALADSIPGATFTVVEAAPHMISLQAPEALAGILA